MYKLITCCCLFVVIFGTTVLSHASHKDEGRLLLFNNGYVTYEGILAADKKFTAAIVEDPTDQEVCLFKAVTGVLVMLLEQGNGSGLETVRDILEAVGMARNSNEAPDDGSPFTDLPESNGSYDLPATTPDGEAIRAFLAGPLATRLDAADALLDIISEDFKTIIHDYETGNAESTEVDYGDVLLLKSMFRFMKSFVLIISAYDLDVDVCELLAIQNIKILLERYPDVLELLPDDGELLLEDARAAMMESIDLFSMAFDFITTTETDPQGDDLFFFDSYEDLREARDFRAVFNEIRASLNQNRLATFTWTDEEWLLTDGDSGIPIYVEIEKNLNGEFSCGEFETCDWTGWPNCGFIACEGEVDEWTVEGSRVTILMSGEGHQIEATLSGTILGGNITNGTYTLSLDGLPVGAGTFTGSRQDRESDTTKMDFNRIFGNGRKSPVNIRQSLPRFDQYNEIIAGTFPEPVLNGFFPDIGSNDDITREMELMPSGCFSIPTADIIIDGNFGDWASIEPVFTDPEGDEDEDVDRSGMDLKEFFLVQDDHFYYCRMTFHEPLGNGSDGWPMYSFMLGAGPDWEPGMKISVVYPLASGALPAQPQVMVLETTWNPNNSIAIATYGADYAARGTTSVEWKIPRPDMGTVSGKFVETWTSVWDAPPPSSPLMSDTGFTRIMLGPASVSGSVACSAYSAGNIFILAAEEFPDINVFGGAIADPDQTFTLGCLPTGKSGFLSAFWDADGNGILSGGDYLSGPTPFTAPAENIVISLSYKPFYLDDDGDGYGDPNTMIAVSIADPPPPDYVENNTDLDDHNGGIYPGALEIPYDGIDQDCNGADLTDVDGDGYNAEISGGSDCDDNEASVNPGASEQCNGEDDDCDGSIDEDAGIAYYLDHDGDGYGDSSQVIVSCLQPAGYVTDNTDCNDGDEDIHPDAADVPGDGIDQDCDGNDPESKPPVVKKVNIVGGPRVIELDIYLEVLIQGDADTYKVWEMGNPEPTEWTALPSPDTDGMFLIPMTLAPTVPGNKDFSTKRKIYFKAGFYSYASKPKKVNVSLAIPKVSALKVNGNNKTGVNAVDITFKVVGVALRYYISGDPNFDADVTEGEMQNLFVSDNGVYVVAGFNLETIDVDEKGRKTVYLKVVNDVGESKVVKAVVRLIVPKVSLFKVNGNNKTDINNVPIMFKFTGNATHYEISSDPTFGTVDAGGEIGALDPPDDRDVYTIPSFDISEFSENKGKKTVYLRLRNDVGYSKPKKTLVTLIVPKVFSLKVKGNNKAAPDVLVPVTFKASADATGYYISAVKDFDPERDAVLASGEIADLTVSDKGLYMVPDFDLSAVAMDAKGKKTLYVKVKNDVKYSKEQKAVVRMDI